jgi:hypothetical protein
MMKGLGATAVAAIVLSSGCAPAPAPAPAPALANAPAPAESKKASSCDEVSCAIDNYVEPCCAKYPRVKPAPIDYSAPDGPPEHPDRTMILDGIAKVKGAVDACGQKLPNAKGIVKLYVTVSSAGSVTATEVRDTPDVVLGACVADAVSHAHFEPTEYGGAFTYPFAFK